MLVHICFYIYYTSPLSGIVFENDFYIAFFPRNASGYTYDQCTYVWFFYQNNLRQLLLYESISWTKTVIREEYIFSIASVCFPTCLHQQIFIL